MKRFAIAFFLNLLLVGVAVGAADAPVEEPKTCQECGMDRTRFAHSRMIVEYEDGSNVGVCSIHCASVEMMKPGGKKVASLKVADMNTKALIEAKTATWVVGGKKKGVMTGVPKWAFAEKKDAQSFVKEFGGVITPFQKVLKASHQEAGQRGR